MAYTIVKNAPLLPKGGMLGSKYPFSQMEINDAFDLSVEERANVVSAACTYGSKNAKKFSVRKHGAGYRCQRVA